MRSGQHRDDSESETVVEVELREMIVAVVVAVVTDAASAGVTVVGGIQSAVGGVAVAVSAVVPAVDCSVVVVLCESHPSLLVHSPSFPPELKSFNYIRHILWILPCLIQCRSRLHL